MSEELLQDASVKSETTTTSENTETINKTMSPQQIASMQKQMYKQRNEQIKQNKNMLEEMELEVRYWKAKRDLVVYRFDMMDYYLKNLEIEPTYLLRTEEEKLKQEKAQNQENKPESLLS